MKPNYKKVSAFTIIAIATVLSGAKAGALCSPKPPVCIPDDCKRCYCLGPENIIANAPVNPKTCNGDIIVTLSGFYWTAHQDGMEYAIENQVIGDDAVTINRGLSNLIEANYLTPDSSWDFGFKFGLGYRSACDGWDASFLWTHYNQKAKSHVEAEFSDNHTLLPLWSGFQFSSAGNSPNLYASDIETNWKLELNLIDIELGRDFWVSRYLSLRPFIGLRGAYIDQCFEIQHKGGSWNDPGMNLNFNDNVKLDNDFKGVGARTGLDSTWNLGCGFGVYGNLAASIIYGKFSIDHDETLISAKAPYKKSKILESKDHMSASRTMLDLGLGLQWGGLFCDCKYGMLLQLGWEHHNFFHQNQLTRVTRIGGTNETNPFNNSGENVFELRRGNLTTQGWTARINLEF